MSSRQHPRTHLVAAVVALFALLPVGPAAGVEVDHSQTIVVGPSERPVRSVAGATGDAITFNGRGSYHSVGMAQYGARGQALAGRSASQIVRSYYTGTSVASRPVGFPIRVGVVHDTPRIRVVPRGAAMSVKFNDRAALPGDADSVWTVTVDDEGVCTTADASGPLHTGGCPTFDPQGRIEVQQPSGSNWIRYGVYGGANAPTAVIDVMADLPGSSWLLDVVAQLPLEQYLYGLAEVPYSWEPAALQAQAIAGRSYAMHRMLQRGASPDGGCSCHVWDSQRDQVYRGQERETSSSWARWRTAVDGTAGQVVLADQGQAGYGETAQGVVQTFYSASSHGRTENKDEVFYPSPWDYMVSVPDDWSLDAPNNPYAAWSVSVPRTTVASKVGLSSVDSVRVTERRESGSAKTVVFSGGGATKTLTGDQVRWAFGLLSNGFGIGSEDWDGYEPPPPPPPSDLFTDDDDSLHEQAIDWLANEEITTGCSRSDSDLFCPERVVTREQMAAFLTRALELEPGTATFEDTGSTTFTAEISSLASAGITKGCNPPENTRYCPRDPVTREQMASFLARALSLPDGARGRFSDVPAGSAHERTIGALAEAGITLGCNPPHYTRFCPGDPVTREQMATFLFRALG